MSVTDLPLVNASINTGVFVLLIVGYVLIRQGRRDAHKWVMLAAVALSVLFLISYVYYHYNHGSTKFTGQGIARPIYFTILISHTVLAIVNLPFVIVTLARALRGQFAAHARVAKRTWAIWVYVALTGPMVYVMLYRMYPAPTAAEAEAAFGAARQLHHDQKDREALDAYRKAAALGSRPASCYAAVLSDRLDETETTSAAFAAAPDDVHCSVLRARALITEDKTDAAIALLEAATKRVPDDAFFWASLGYARFRTMSYDEAAAAFEKSASLDPSLPANLFNAGYAYYLGGRYSKAKPLLEQALEKKLDAELLERAKESLDVIGGALWVCPMHPNVTGKAGEKCPECGMKLEPAPHGLKEEDEQ